MGLNRQELEKIGSDDGVGAPGICVGFSVLRSASVRAKRLSRNGDLLYHDRNPGLHHCSQFYHVPIGLEID
jgi:hypothetical protein